MSESGLWSVDSESELRKYCEIFSRNVASNGTCSYQCTVKLSEWELRLLKNWKDDSNIYLYAPPPVRFFSVL